MRHKKRKTSSNRVYKEHRDPTLDHKNTKNMLATCIKFNCKLTSVAIFLVPGNIKIKMTFSRVMKANFRLLELGIFMPRLQCSRFGRKKVFFQNDGKNLSETYFFRLFPSQIKFFFAGEKAEKTEKTPRFWTEKNRKK